ncbi:hypothetical protein Tco_0457664 [Tanacetum coccineum]
MWLVILTTYNLPLWLCMKESSFMLTLLIYVPKSPGKDIDVYLRSLIDDLKDLWAKPIVETIDVATFLKFNMRAMVLWTINDFPARSSLFGWCGQGYRACPTCNEDTPSMRVLGKTAYVGYKRFLKKPHKWRRSLEFNGETENKDPPREFNWDAIMTQLVRLPTRVKDKHLRSVTHGVKDPGVSASSELFALACGPTPTPISVNSCVVNGVRFIDVVDEDDDIIDEEDPIPHDLADSDDEDLVNLDIDDGVNVMSADVARGHGGDGGGDDRPPPYQVPTGCGGCLGNRGKGTRKPNLGGRRAGRPHTRQDPEPGLKPSRIKMSPVPIPVFEELPLSTTLLGAICCRSGGGGRGKDWTQFDLRPHMESDRWPQIYAGIQQHLQKIYNGKKAALKERYWVPEEDGTYDLDASRPTSLAHFV